MFNAKQYRQENPVERTLPTGWYKVRVKTSALGQSSNGDEMVTMAIQIVDSISGHFINAYQWENLVIGHESEKVRKIANDKIVEIMLACGVEEIKGWNEIAERGQEFAMSIGKSERTGRTYAVYRPISAWDAMVARMRQPMKTVPMINGVSAFSAPPAVQPPLSEPSIDFDDDIPF